MRVLVVGGTGFLGGAIARAAIAAGDEVAVLSRRAVVGADRSDIETLTGDRHHDLSALRGRRFDLIFDSCGYAPDAVERLLDAAAHFDGRYVFISSCSVYGDYSSPGIVEEREVPYATAEHLALAASLPSERRADAASYGKAYGPLKAACERAAIELLGERALILRSGLLVGAGDYTDRLTWWLRRIDAGGPIPIPGPTERSIQLIDVSDAAAFAYLGGSSGLHGIYNLTGRPMPMKTVLDTARQITRSDAQLVWLDAERVVSSGVEAWTDIPLWLPPTDVFRHFFEIDVEKACAAGLRARPLDKTLTDILTWDRKRQDRALHCGMSKAQEDALLAGAPIS